MFIVYDTVAPAPLGLSVAVVHSCFTVIVSAVSVKAVDMIEVARTVYENTYVAAVPMAPAVVGPIVRVGYDKLK